MPHVTPPLAHSNATRDARTRPLHHKQRLALARLCARQIGVFLLCAFCARGQLYGVLAPFVLTLAIAADDADSAAALLGGAVGAVLFLPLQNAIVLLCVLGAMALVRWLFAESDTLALITACACLPAITLLCALAGVLGTGDVLCALCEATFAGAVGWFLRRNPPAKEPVSALVLLCIILVCAAGLAAPFCWIAPALASLVCVTMAYRGKTETALICAFALSLALSLGNESFVFVGIGLLAASLATAQFGASEKAQSTLLFLGAALLGAFASAYGAADLFDSKILAGVCFMGSVGVGLLAFLLLPPDILRAEASDAAARAQQMRPNFSIAGAQLGAVAQSLSDIAETVNDVYGALPRGGDDFNWVIEHMQETLCNNCKRRETCWLKDYGDTTSALFALKPVLQETEHVGVEHFPAGLSRCIHPAALASEMTRAYALYRSKSEARVHTEALRGALTEQYGAVAAALEGLSAQLGEPGVPDIHKTRRVAELFVRLGMPPLECAVTREPLGRLRVALTLPRTGIKQEELQTLAGEISRICARAIELPQKLSCRDVTTLIFTEKPALRPVFGVAYRAAVGEVSGDAVQQFCRAHTAEMILCDGMGTGCPAAVDGNLAAELTARLLKASFSAETAARLVNVALALKSDEESGASLDLISVDLYTGTAHLFKAGAAPGFVVQGGRAKAIGGDSLPVGIVDVVQGQSISLRLQKGDYAVLVSDGMLLDGGDWILQQLALSAATAQAPQELANLLVNTARLRAHACGRPDDITAAVMRLEAY